MKKYISKFLMLFLSVSLATFVGCEDDKYDFDAIVPIVQDFDGPTEAFAAGAGFVTYSISGRGGSTFEYSVTGIGATIVKSESQTSANITFAQSDVDVSAVVTVVETTLGGVVSEPVSLNVNLFKFKGMAYEDFLGAWEGTGIDDEVLNFIAVAGESDEDTESVKTIILKAVDGIPALYPSIFTAWGEIFQPGFGNEGDIKVLINLDNGGVTIPYQYWGQTLPGPWTYYISGDGLWEGFGKTMTIVTGFDDPQWNVATMSITKL